MNPVSGVKFRDEDFSLVEGMCLDHGFALFFSPSIFLHILVFILFRFVLSSVCRVSFLLLLIPNEGSCFNNYLLRRVDPFCCSYVL